MCRDGSNCRRPYNRGSIRAIRSSRSLRSSSRIISSFSSAASVIRSKAPARISAARVIRSYFSRDKKLRAQETERTVGRRSKCRVRVALGQDVRKVPYQSDDLSINGFIETSDFRFEFFVLIYYNVKYFYAIAEISHRH